MITDEHLEAIESRASSLSCRYYFLEKEDLMQEGYALLLSLDNKGYTDRQMLKAINNMFINKERHAMYQRRLEKNMSSFEDLDEIDTPLEDETVEDRLEREQMTELLLKSLTAKQKLVLEWLTAGLSLNDIAANLGVNRDNARRVVMSIVKKREEIERG